MDGSLVDIFMSVATYGAVVAAGVSVLAGMFYTVPQRHIGLITQFGKLVKAVEEPGLHMKIPFIQTVAEKVSTAIQQISDPLDTKTKDNLFVKLPITIQFQVKDAPKYYFNTDKPEEQMAKIVSASVRKYTSGKDFQELYTERDEISEAVIKDVKGHISDYGVEIVRIVIDEPKATTEVQNSYNNVRASEQNRIAAVNNAEAEKVTTVKQAEAHRDRDLLRGEGAAGYRQKVFDQYAGQIKALEGAGTSREEAVHVMLKVMELDTYREAAEKGNMVIVVPSSGASSGSANTLTDMATYSKVLERVTGKTAEAKAPGLGLQ